MTTVLFLCWFPASTPSWVTCPSSDVQACSQPPRQTKWPSSLERAWGTPYRLPLKRSIAQGIKVKEHQVGLATILWLVWLYVILSQLPILGISWHFVCDKNDILAIQICPALFIDRWKVIVWSFRPLKLSRSNLNNILLLICFGLRNKFYKGYI